ncbi:MAG: fluoride efflux transporter CrcB [Paludibacteraceae bacterium]|nr:fluoride efflux transporter CrcB [Paludibacteraceae bacterium]
MKQLLLVGFGGFFGSIARYWMSKLNLTWDFHSIPMGTLAVNIIGSFLIGFMLGIFMNSNLLHTNLKLFLVVGFCGGFTTFSSFTNENFLLLQNGQYLTALIYIGGSIIIGILAVFAGFLIANQL